MGAKERWFFKAEKLVQNRGEAQMNRKAWWMGSAGVLGLALAAGVLMAARLTAAAAGEGQGYVGSEVCQGCHQELFSGFQKHDPHWKAVGDPKVPSQMQGCESCHGPGQKHVDTGDPTSLVSFKGASGLDRSEACLKCHSGQRELFQFRRSPHKLTSVACNDCHQIHSPPQAAHRLKAKETELCLSCHQELRGKLQMPSRHKVLEGAIKCTDCHTPHGTRTRASLRKWNKFNDDVCFECHAEKRGPWVFEHLAVKVEGCMVCHEPHGSPNRFMLIRRDVRRLCVECHGVVHFAPTSCINCHTQIHGSNFSRRFFQ